MTFNYATDMDFHYELIELLAKRMRPTLYVELGIDDGLCIGRVARYCERAIGVDKKPPRSVEGFEFFHGDTSAFARRVLPTLPPIDLAFIDADHRFQASLRDFEALLVGMSDDGVILLHDTYPQSKRWLDVTLCADSYRTADHIHKKCHHYGVEIVTLPTPPGVSLLRKRKRQLIWSDAE